MPTFKSRGLRGSNFEEMVNRTNDYYRSKGLLIVQKIPTPITPITIDEKSRHITLAYFEMKSTVDYMGAVQGYPVCFDCKEISKDRVSLQNIHPHQVDFMKEFQLQGGIAFFLFYFTHREIYYYMPIDDMEVFVNRSKEEKGRKSFNYNELKEEYFFKMKPGLLVPYLDMIALNLKKKEENT